MRKWGDKSIDLVKKIEKSEILGENKISGRQNVAAQNYSTVENKEKCLEITIKKEFLEF